MANIKKEKKFLIIMDNAIDTKTDWFVQITNALDEAGIYAWVHELDEDDDDDLFMEEGQTDGL